MQRVTGKLNFSNFIALIALFVALGGTAIAAKHYVITSTKQISPRVLKKLVKPRTAGATGAPGKNGLPGTAGTPGTSSILSLAAGRAFGSNEILAKTNFTVPQPATALIRADGSIVEECLEPNTSVCVFEIGLFVDGEEVFEGNSSTIQGGVDFPRQVAMPAVTTVSAGPHVLELRCRAIDGEEEGICNFGHEELSVSVVAVQP